MVGEFLELYLMIFFIIAAGYAFLLSCTSIFYKKKSFGQLSPNELKVKQGTATAEVKMDLFFRSLFTAIFTYQMHLIALAITGVIYLIIYMTP